MGAYTRAGTQIRDFTPDDTAETLYLDSSCSWALSDLLERARQKWGEAIAVDDLSIEADYLHTHCLGYDRYDPSDYTKYLVITYRPSLG